VTGGLVSMPRQISNQQPHADGEDVGSDVFFDKVAVRFFCPPFSGSGDGDRSLLLLPTLFIGWVSTAPLMVSAAAVSSFGRRWLGHWRRWMVRPLLFFAGGRPMLIHCLRCVSEVIPGAGSCGSTNVWRLLRRLKVDRGVCACSDGRELRRRREGDAVLGLGFLCVIPNILMFLSVKDRVVLYFFL
jgi:hypothetical protein